MTYPAFTERNVNLNLPADKQHQAGIDSAYATGKPDFELSYDYWTNYAEKDALYHVLINSPEIDYQADQFTMTL